MHIDGAFRVLLSRRLDLIYCLINQQQQRADRGVRPKQTFTNTNTCNTLIHTHTPKHPPPCNVNAFNQKHSDYVGHAPLYVGRQRLQHVSSFNGFVVGQPALGYGHVWTVHGLGSESESESELGPVRCGSFRTRFQSRRRKPFSNLLTLEEISSFRKYKTETSASLVTL